MNLSIASVKRRLVNTWIGSKVIQSREMVNLLTTTLWNPEQCGTTEQDYIATKLLPRLCTPSKTFVDVGAHIGSVVAAVQRYSPHCPVIAVEAIPEKAIHLNRKFPDVNVLNYAVGDSDCEVTFYINVRRSGYSSLTRPKDDTATAIQVEMRRLDRLLENVSNIDVMKIDVEGAELRVLNGASKTVEQNRPIIMFESVMGDVDCSIEDLKSIFSYFASRRYEIFVPNRLAHNGPSLSAESFVESHYYPRRATNYFSVPIERRNDVRDRARQIMSIQVL